MLKSSRYSVTFPINGQQFEGTITYQPGVTVVVGRNGSGKTLGTIELWRYLLFGKKALRGPASDYRSMNAEGVLEIRGVEYRIVRNSKEEKVYKGEEVLAVGADAVNKKLIELLGFSLEVFDITNASVQKKATQLTQLTPAKRKELIDEVVGLSQTEQVEKDCKNQSKLKKLEADTIRDNLHKPTKPTKPAGYKPQEQLVKKLGEAREIERDRINLSTIVDNVRSQPTPPTMPRPDIAFLQRHEQERLETDAERAGLQAKLDSIPTAKYTQEQVDAAEEAQRRGPKPELALDAVRLGLDAWHLHELGETQVECPRCDYQFAPGAVPAPNKPHSFFQEQLLRHERWPDDIDAHPDLFGSELIDARVALDRSAERELLVDRILSLPHYDNLSDQLAGARLIEQQWWAYDRDVEEWKNNQKAASDALQTLQALPKPIDLEALEKLYISSVVYENELEAYERDAKRYEEAVAKSAKLSEEADGFSLGAKRLNEARRELKAFLAPSISRIASALINEMTCGKLTSVHVDEDMNISVDGQDVATLSGAGETAANLAVRLALGRTLVSGVFPVFMGDEIDADADEERSEAVFECLRNLKTQFSQVIIITHKPHVLADHVIDLDE